MNLLRVFSPRLLAFFDGGIFIISASVYARTAASVHSSIPHEIKIFLAVSSSLPLLLLLIIAVLCFRGGRKGFLAAMLLSSVMAVIAITIAGAGGWILIFLDGCESGVDPVLDVFYYTSFFMIGGGFLLLGYMILHIISLFIFAKRIPG